MKTEYKIDKPLLIRANNLFIKIIFALLILSFQISCTNNKIIYPERKSIIEAVYASGKIISENEHGILALNNGTVIKKFINDGDTVTKGQLLYILKKEMPSMEGQSKLYNNLTAEKIFIRSDCDCLIYQSTKEEGETVKQKELLVLAGDTAKRIAALSVDQLDITRIKLNQMVLLKTDLKGDTIYKGTVKKIYPLMNESNQTFRVDVELNDNLNLPFIHNTVDGNIVIQKKDKALVLPTNAILDGDSIYIERNGGEQKIKVKTGIRDIDFIEVLSGIDERTKIIIK